MRERSNLFSYYPNYSGQYWNQHLPIPHQYLCSQTDRISAHYAKAASYRYGLNALLYKKATLSKCQIYRHNTYINLQRGLCKKIMVIILPFSLCSILTMSLFGYILEPIKRIYHD